VTQASTPDPTPAATPRTEAPATPVSAPAETAAAPAPDAPAAALPSGAAASPAPVAARGFLASALRWLPGLALLIALGALAWIADLSQRLRATEEEFARRQQESAALVIEARTLSRQAEEIARDMAAKLALLEAKVAESALQRGQLEELMQSMSRSRDENVLADIEAALRVAQQQSAITGSADPLVTALKQTDERLARMQQPRLERVRRAALKDLERVRAAGSVDITTLTLRLDEVTRQIDELPLVSALGRSPLPAGTAPTPSASPTADKDSAARIAAPAPAASAAVSRVALSDLRQMAAHVWNEVRQLVRVTRIDRPEAALLAPEQVVFLRENLRLRLLNARLSLLSRQFDAAQADLRQAQALLDRYFDRSSRRVLAASELLRQTATQARSVATPVPEATLAALAAAVAGR
jgi:uroporphyrin-III C-methyltransferase